MLYELRAVSVTGGCGENKTPKNGTNVGENKKINTSKSDLKIKAGAMFEGRCECEATTQSNAARICHTTCTLKARYKSYYGYLPNDKQDCEMLDYSTSNVLVQVCAKRNGAQHFDI